MKDMMRDDVAGPCVSASGSLPPDMYWAADRVLITNNRSDNRGMLERDRAATARAAGRLLKVLLNSAALESDANYETLRPLWVEEAIHRRNRFLTLVLRLVQRAPRGSHGHLAGPIELALAADLVALYQSLVSAQERQVMPCSLILRGVVSDLVTLFGPAAGAISLQTDIDSVALPGFQRRALVLVASELVINALCHAFKGRRQGRLRVELRVVDRWHARLTVADDGVGRVSDVASRAYCVARGLADLLGATLDHRASNRDGMTAEVAFALNI